MATTLEMLIRAKYLSQGAGTIESDLKNIKKAISDLRSSSMTVDIDQFLPKPGSIAGVERELASVIERLNQYKEASVSAFGQGESGRGAGMAIKDTIAELEKYKKVLQDVINSTKQTSFNASDYILSSSDVATIEGNIARVKGELDSLRQAMSKAMLIDDKDATGSFQKQIKELEAYRKTWEDTLKAMRLKQAVSPADMILSQQDTLAIKARASQVRQELEGLKNALAKMTVSGQDTTGAKKRIQELSAELNTLKAVVGDKDSLRLDPSQYIFKQGDVDTVHGRIRSLEQDIQRYKQAAVSLAAEGNDKLSQSFVSLAKDTEKQKKALEDMVPTVKKSGDAIDSLLTNRITRLGFGIFAFQQSIRTVTTVISGFFNTLLEGASSLDRSRSFEILVTGQGISPGAMASKLKVASQGLLTMDQAMAKTIQLAKAGFPEIAKNADVLLRIATNASIVSGDLSQVSTVYDKLIRGIIRGSPLLIDDADIVLKLGDANAKYAASIGKTVEQLTAAERVQATYNAVIQEGARINQLAEQMDSTAIKIARLKTEWQEFTEALKESMAIALISSDSVKETAGSIYILTESFTSLSSKERLALLKEMMSSLKGWGVLLGMTAAFAVEAVKDMALRVTTWFKLIGESINLLKNYVALLGLGFEHLWATIEGKSRKAGIIGQRISSLTDEIAGQNEALKEYIKTVASIDGSGFASKVDEMLEAAGLIMGKRRIGIEIDAGGEEAAAQQTTDNLAKLLRERARMAEDIEYERVNKIREINRNHVDKMRDIARKLADTLLKITQDLNQKLADLQQKHLDKLSDLAQTLSDKMADIDQGLADKLEDVQRNAAEKRADAEENYRKGLLDAEEDYQKKLRDIQRKYEASRLKALIDRDARGLFEADQQRKQDIEAAQESAEEKRRKELEKLQEKINDINKKEEEQRQDAIKNAEKRRQDAILAYERARRDALQAYERARQDAIQDAERRRREARDAAAKERQDALLAQANARRDLQNWYRDKLRDLTRFHQDELREYGQHYSNLNEVTGQFMQQQADAWSGFLNRNREWVGIGNPIDPETGQEWPDWRNPGNVYEGGRCNRGSSQVTPGRDGRQYVCINNRWRVFTGAGIGSTGAMATGMSGATLSSPVGGIGVSAGQRIKVVLEGNGDDALTQIIKSGAYEAFVEIMS